MPHDFTATLRARWIGEQLRKLRRQRDMTLEQVAVHLDRDLSALGRYERGQWPVRRADVVALLDLYGCYDPDHRAHLLAVAEQIWHRHRWEHDQADSMTQFIDCEWLAAHAQQVRIFDPLTVPEPLRTPQYTSQLGQTGPRRLTPAGVPVEIMVTEQALRRRLRHPTVVRDQLNHLARMATGHPDLTVRVLTTIAAVGLPVTGGFAVFVMPDPYPPVAHLDTVVGDLYAEVPIADHCAGLYQRLSDAALTPEQSRDLITMIATETGNHLKQPTATGRPV